MTLVQQLQTCSGALATTLAFLERCCIGGQPEAERNEALAQLLELIPDRTAALALSFAHGKTCWPAHMGQSPYEEVIALLREALAGKPSRPGSTNVERSIHEALLKAYALPTALARWQLDREGLWTRYPRLLRSMVQAALLTQREAEAALHVLLHTHPCARERSPGSSEAVSHFGGNLATVRAARRWRHRFASTARLPLAA